MPILYDGVISLIEKLRSSNYETYLWTGRDQYSAQKILSFYKIDHLFKEMHFRDTATPKPSPDALGLMLNQVDKSNAVLIGDSVVDIMGATNFGISCLVVDWMNKANHKELLKAGARQVFSKPNDVFKWIESEL